MEGGQKVKNSVNAPGVHQGEAAGRWQSHYAGGRSNERLYPTEWVVRTLAGGNYPRLQLDRSSYPPAPGSSI